METRIVFLPQEMDSLTDETYHRCLNRIDQDAQTRVKRFYRREDSWRSLIGMLLPQILLREHKIPLDSVMFSRTKAGKPFIEEKSPNHTTAIGFNISHDARMIAMASQVGLNENADMIGIDVMKRVLPRGETLRSFLQAIGDTLTESELSLFTPDLDVATGEKYVFLLWTLKEAYTKALGLGLGFDFKRIQYDILHNCVFVDDQPARGWSFLMFDVKEPNGLGIYQGSIARFIGGEQTQINFITYHQDDPTLRIISVEELISAPPDIH
ncbi:hypothetical protein BU17DRAFT_80015 [Hysterangium stoloniferum]|nr:hypothetical protein BU17DRAFT_80015 [Hysterangium stoloniferum]